MRGMEYLSSYRGPTTTQGYIARVGSRVSTKIRQSRDTFKLRFNFVVSSSSGGQLRIVKPCHRSVSRASDAVLFAFTTQGRIKFAALFSRNSTTTVGVSSLPSAMLTVSQRCNLCTRPPPAPKPQDGPGALQLQAPRRPPISRWRCSHAVNSFLPWQREQQPALTVPESSATSVAEQSLEHPALLTPVEALHDVATRVRGRQPAATPSTSATQPAPIISGSGGGIFFFWQLGT